MMRPSPPTNGSLVLWTEMPQHSDQPADAIDGLPFAAHEQRHTCRCGAPYRTETLHWLAENLAGCCTLCARPLIPATVH